MNIHYDEHNELSIPTSLPPLPALPSSAEGIATTPVQWKPGVIPTKPDLDSQITAKSHETLAAIPLKQEAIELKKFSVSSFVQGLIGSLAKKVVNFVQSIFSPKTTLDATPVSSNINDLDNITREVRKTNPKFSEKEEQIRNQESKLKESETQLEHAKKGTDKNVIAKATKQVDIDQNKLYTLKKQLAQMKSKWIAQDDKNYEKFTSSLVKNRPNISINSRSYSPSEPKKLDLNNNGLRVDSGKAVFTGNSETIIRDGQAIVLQEVSQATIGDKTYDFAPGKAYYAEGKLYTDPKDARYHDEVLVSGGKGKGAVITLCDGSGHSDAARPTAKTAAKTAHEALSDNISKCKTTGAVLKLQMQAIKQASESVSNGNGSTTYIQAAVVGDQLVGASLGDSKAYIFRKNENGDGWTAFDPLGNPKETLDGAESGGQLGVGESNLGNINVFSFNLKAGDVVYVCSDGIVDNFDPSVNITNPNELDSTIEESDWQTCNPKHIEASLKGAKDSIEMVIKNCKSGEEIAKTIADFLEENTREKKIQFMTNSDKNNKGKLDDAAAGYFTYEK